jgi:methylenetetrahydrofolate reductase (NADPH)
MSVTGPSHLKELLGCSSLEATLPTEAELGELRQYAQRGAPLYLSAPPGQLPQQLVRIAKSTRAAGFEPVPHIAARNFPSRATLKDFVERLAGEAGARSALVVAGDTDCPAGPFEGAIGVIESDLLQTHGITRIGISGYPDGHAKLDNRLLPRALTGKLKSAADRGLNVHIVSQFCFDADRIIAWLKNLRAERIEVPVKIGLAGPTSARGLARYALRCGVRTSLRAMRSGSAFQLFGDVAPDAIVRDLAGATDLVIPTNTSFHFFSFGGLVRTARWLSEHKQKSLDGLLQKE